MMRKMMVRNVLQKLLESGVIDNLTLVLASVESELLETAVDLEEAHGIEHIRGSQMPTVEGRQETLKALIGALAQDNFAEVWIENVAPELIDNADRAEQYVDMDADEWEAQIETWADSYRSGGATGSDRALADHHINDVFGTNLEYFEERFVEFDRGQEAERLFAGNLRAVRDSMRQATEAVREDQGDA
jgi:hypothetical protein